ncbi:exodeoxyribonuclease VII small subunit [Listeria aquatica]|uniref:Exodeoxyribonuclease 7 small subunit n=2 Tax=Listeria aquatica TaxID=1494960 RepID=W7B492_9LIST|nr:exodeoxyribonuclease VII small subunit [Listeria aquatica]EUJ17561.1 exodeoxyribonuclease VII small subunit [Listeria aquatica FSL S10-1188]MBC1521086.1 exodeoxyribonuclease VII small subunit [Listeria aquatica]
MATKKEQTFEEALKELEEIVVALESGTATLEESLNMYQRGIELSKLCETKLKTAEDKMAKVVDEEGNEAPLDVEGE